MARRLVVEALAVQIAAGVACSAVALAVSGPSAALGVAAGTLLAVADLAVIAFLVSTIASGKLRSRALCLAALVAKMPLLAAAVWAAVVALGLHVIGLVTGVSTVFPAVFFAAYRHQRLASTEI